MEQLELEYTNPSEGSAPQEAAVVSASEPQKKRKAKPEVAKPETPRPYYVAFAHNLEIAGSLAPFRTAEAMVANDWLVHLKNIPDAVLSEFESLSNDLRCGAYSYEGIGTPDPHPRVKLELLRVRGNALDYLKSIVQDAWRSTAGIGEALTVELFGKSEPYRLLQLSHEGRRYEPLLPLGNVLHSIKHVAREDYRRFACGECHAKYSAVHGNFTFMHSLKNLNAVVMYSTAKTANKPCCGKK